MKTIYSTLLIVLFSAYTFSQVAIEDCSNGIDDDGDGMVDCFDVDCKNIPVPGTSFFNTASNGNNAVLPGGTFDLNWQVSNALNGPYNPAIVVAQIPPTYINSPWPDCSWISHAANCTHAVDTFFYYKIEFMLPCFTPCGSVANGTGFCLNLDLYSDNSIDEVFVNGVPQSANIPGVPIATPFNNPGFMAGGGITTSLCNNWKPGLNVLVVRIGSGVPHEAFLAQTSTTIAPFVIPDATINNANLTMCINAAPTTLTATTAGGTWSSSCGTCINSSTGSFNPAAAGAGTHTVIYTITTPCPDADTITVTVLPLPIVTINPEPDRCETDAAFNFTSQLAGGTWSGTGITDATLGTFNPSTAGVGTHTITYSVTNPCPNSGTITITVNPIATANAGQAQTICAGTAAVLAGTVGGSATSGTWSGGTGNYTPNTNSLNASYTPSATEIANGSVTLTLTSNDPAGPCPPATSTVTIAIEALPTVNAGPSQTICIGNNAQLAGTFGGTATSAYWSGGTGTYTPNNTAANATYTPSAAETAAGSVTLTYTTDDPPGPCGPATSQVVILIRQIPTANAGNNQIICPGSSILLNGIIGGAATSATWIGGNGTYSPNNTSLNTTYTPSAAEIASGAVTLMLITDDPAGPCLPDTSTVTITFHELPNVNFAVDTAKGCPIHCVNFIDLSTVNNPSTISSWLWNFGDLQTSTLQNPSHCYLNTGTYNVSLTVTSNNGCTASKTIPNIIEVFAIPTAEFTITPNPLSITNSTANIFNQSSSDVVYWNWTFGDGSSHPDNITPNPSHTYPVIEGVSYDITLIVKNTDGCWDTITHPVFVGPEFTFFIPNSFTPNDDGINDSFNGTGVGIQKYDIWIFDRWGNMIFHSNSLTSNWDGKANGGAEIAQQDVYVWKVALKDIFNKEHRYIGTVTLVK